MMNIITNNYGKIIPFKKTDFSNDGIHLHTGKFIYDLQRDWKENFHNHFNPYFANVMEGHPLAMQQLTLYMEGGNESDFDFGMELIDGEIDIDTNLAIEEFSEEKTVYAIGSQFRDEEDNPLFLIKNENLTEEILVLKYVPDSDEEEEADLMPITNKINSKI
jgi:hypothetical protein